MMHLLRVLLNLPDGASTIADRVDLLHAFVIGLTLAIATYVFTAAAWFSIRYHRKHEQALTAHFEASRRREATIIGAVLVTFVALWVVGFRQYMTMRDAPANAETVFVDAKQWMWKFAYADGRSSNDVLTVPLGHPIKLVMTSRDVIHSFFVPAFRLKTDVLPGRYTTMWFEATELGTFPIWCAEYCGVDHSTMLGSVVVVSPEDYASWRRRGDRPVAESSCAGGSAQGTCADAALVQFGRETATKRQCVACHTFDGQRHVGPTWSRLYGSTRTLRDGRTVVADDAYLTRSMMEPLADIVAGYDPVMPTYQGTLTSAEVGSLVELIKSLRDEPERPGIVLPTLSVDKLADGGAAP